MKQKALQDSWDSRAIYQEELCTTETKIYTPVYINIALETDFLDTVSTIYKFIA